MFGVSPAVAAYIIYFVGLWVSGQEKKSSKQLRRGALARAKGGEGVSWLFVDPEP